MLFLLFASFSVFIKANKTLDSLLYILDETILFDEKYVAEHLNYIEGLKKEINKNESISFDIYKLNQSIYEAYRAFNCDSAILYLNKNIELADKLGDLNLRIESRLTLSYLLSSAGMYIESSHILSTMIRKDIPSHLLLNYYDCFSHLYGELSVYTQYKEFADAYGEISQLYRDSLYNLLPRDSKEYLELYEAKLRNEHLYQEALKINELRLNKVDFNSPDYALVTYHRSLNYRYMNDVENEKINLCLSAISDIRLAIKDHASLWTLAQLLYEGGDIERAYKYIRFSWNATKFYNARLRSWQSADALSLIDKTYQAMIEKQNNRLQQNLWIISALLLLLVIAVIRIYSQMKKLSVARNHLQVANTKLNSLNEELLQTNDELKETNTDLIESNIIKEEYIARFIKLSSRYINRLDAYRRMVSKKITTKKVQELLDITRSPNLLDEELKELYTSFDTAFLHIFPDFVKKFNLLLKEDEQIVLKKDELLNTELRIFALIRLGIEDSSQIAEFLRYSVNTIYNYRAKVKNKARISRDDFEDIIKNLR